MAAGDPPSPNNPGETNVAANESGWQPLSGYYGEGSLSRVFNQRGYEQVHRYVMMMNLDFELELLSKDDRDFVICETFFATAFGRTVFAALPFSPMDGLYGVSPFWERRREELLYRAGWYHYCLHLILQAEKVAWYARNDVQTALVVFENRVFAGAGTPTIRRAVQRARHRNGLSGRPRDRLIWYAEAGYYMHNLPGVAPTFDMTKGMDWIWDVSLRLGYPLWATPAHALVAGVETTALLDPAGRAHWRGRMELELLFNRNPLGTSLFATWTPADPQPLHNREGLVEAGLRFIL